MKQRSHTTAYFNDICVIFVHEKNNEYMRISGYCHNSSPGIKLIILLLLILWGALIVAIPMFFVKGSNALLIAMYLQNIGMFILPAWIAATLFWGNAGKSLYLNKAPRIIEL